MKKLKALTLLTLLLLSAVFWGTTTAMVFIEYTDLLAILSTIGYFMVWFFVFWIHIYTNGYKLKYLFLGKRFKQQLKTHQLTLNKLPKHERKKAIKSMKDEYRKFGTTSITVYNLNETPYKVFTEDNLAFNYGNALDKQKIEFIAFCLQSNSQTGGLYRFFEEIDYEPFTYDELKSLIKSSDCFSKELKLYLLNPKFKTIFSYFKKATTLTDKEHERLEKFELGESNFLYDYSDELTDIVEKMAVENYLFYKQRDSLPDTTTRLYVSKDLTERIYIFFDPQSRYYKIGSSTFKFLDPDNRKMYSICDWINNTESSIFQDEILALNEIKSKIKDFTEVL